jgi:hypothetical protein
MVGLGDRRPHGPLPQDRPGVCAGTAAGRGLRQRAAGSAGPVAAYLAARFADDTHIWTRALSGEVVPLGYGLSYASFAGAAGGACALPPTTPIAAVCAWARVYLLEDINDPTGGKVSMNKPDEKETRNAGTPGCYRPRRRGSRCLARDEQVDARPIPGLGELAFVWIADEPATYPNAGNNPAAPGIFPPVGGIRFTMATYSPEFDVVAPQATPEMHIEDGNEPGMHRTDTTDLGSFSGNIGVEVDGGAEFVAVCRRCRGAERNTPSLARGWGPASRHGDFHDRSPAPLVPGLHGESRLPRFR